MTQAASMPTILTVPGLGSSGPTHWQTLWERQRAEVVRAELGMWDTPHRNSWVTKLDQAIRGAQAPVVLVAHSLGCQAVAWWAALSGQPYGWPVAGALLVAPADVDRADAPPELTGFAPAPTVSLPFPSLLVTSTDDPWISEGRARALANQWGSHLFSVGALGHINAASGVGDWSEGQALLAELIDMAGLAHNPTQGRALLAARLSVSAEQRPTLS
ncbi:hypothetical protein SAMN06297144_3341 [Sphingomonas guangdongensis]|uniref:Alpha/beta hydrolase n=1 Tax=Sphingomonas guangdongensis TaxID=1141890 RepID=A0A285R259_9SPHN|nr:alpha/beta hydrolase [Sphingomonas guangdongensis]SOB88196.1 hypothetical protein SAMN06297144_3341 [Sphingomonas guangdongensis]